MKDVPADKTDSLGKLPTKVRNKMGYKKGGGYMKKKDGGSMSEGMMEDYTSVSKELSAKEQSKKKDTPKPKRKPKEMAKGGKVGKYNCSHNRLY
jgi:hypothetical protein